MPKVKKVHRRKRYNANINRKRLRSKTKKGPIIECKDIQQAWELTKSTRSNLKEMGLAYDPNQVIAIKNTKQEFIEEGLKKLGKKVKKDLENNAVELPKKFVVESLEEDAKAPREKLFRLPKGQVQFITYMLDKYGDDFKAMTRDPKNINQLTWKQFRAKAKQFKKIPEQYNEYLAKKGEQL